MMTMREKIARAMFAVSDTYAIGHTWETISEQHRFDYLNEADAALDALMEPTDAMVDAVPEGCDGFVSDTWVPMIRAAKDGA